MNTIVIVSSFLHTLQGHTHKHIHTWIHLQNSIKQQLLTVSYADVYLCVCGNVMPAHSVSQHAH